MTVMLKAEQLLEAALVLPETERANLASELLASLPEMPLADLNDEETYQEMLRRDAEMDAEPDSSLSLEQFRDEVLRMRRV